MKKMLFQLGVVVFGLLVSANIYSQECGDQGQGCCPPDAACDASTGDCWCRYVHYEPCNYTTTRCVTDAIPCQKQCCRMVPKYYQVQKCRYVPQYYCETACRMEPEYYCVPDCKYVQRTVCDQHTRYIPRYYWKHTCGDNTCQAPCPTTSPVPANCCPPANNCAPAGCCQ